MKRLLPVFELLRDSALRLGGADETFIAETHETKSVTEPVEYRRPSVHFEEVISNG